MAEQTLEQRLERGMLIMFRKYREVEPLTEVKIKELAKDILDKNLVLVTDQNMNQLPMASFLVAAFLENNDFGNQSIQFLATMTQGLCGSMKVILTTDWNKAIEVYKKAMDVFE